MNIIILGSAGSGKSTQGELLANKLGIPHLSVGDLLFYASQEDSSYARLIREAMTNGELVDSNIMHKILENHLKQAEHIVGTLLDGHPRTLQEARDLDSFWKADKVIYIKISDGEAIKRLTARGRGDDTEEIIKKRLEIYHKETEPALEYYRNQGVLLEIDGERRIEEIASDIESRFLPK